VNDIIQQLKSHCSIRKFTSESVSEEQLRAIISAAQMASTSSNVQAYSVIRVQNADRKQRLAELCGNQKYIEECPLFLVWCADLHRLRQAYSLHGNPEDAYLDTTENMLIAIIDASLAAQNAAVAAESLGLGIVYIGGIRNRIAEVSELLKLPDRVLPLFGMCVGWPDQAPTTRPRLPAEAVVHAEEYTDDHLIETIREYDQDMEQYLLYRTGGKRSSTWSWDMQAKLSVHARPHMSDFLRKIKFASDIFDK
jgi:FMN reductase (NADPH)